MAGLQQRADAATAAADAARADAAREAHERSRADVARRADRARCEALEREVARLQRARKAPPRSAAEVEAEKGRRRAAVSLALNTRIHVIHLHLSHAFGIWRLLADTYLADRYRAPPDAALQPSGWYQGLRPPRPRGTRGA